MMRKIHPHMTGRMLNSLLFGALFILIGQFLPATYYKYFDDREYVSVELPVDTDLKVYNPCDSVLLNTQIRSMIHTSLDVRIQLTMVRADNAITPVDSKEVHNIIIKAGVQPYSVPVPIPCRVDEGIYYFEGNIIYVLRGVEHTEYFYSGKFNVVSTPLSPKPGRDEVL
jgi:hypothetical protein